MKRRNTAEAVADPASEPEMLPPTDNVHALVPVLPDDLAQELARLNALSQLGRADRTLPFRVFNAKVKDTAGNWIARDVFYDTLSGETCRSINAVLLHVRKNRRRSVYVEGVGTHVLCRSMDALEGVTEEGEVLDCETCPHKEWQGREKPRCSLIYTFLGLDLAQGGNPFLIRAKHTSLQPAKKYLARHFEGRLKTPEGAADLPLFVYRTKLALVMPTGNYAVLAFENAGACTEAEIREHLRVFNLFRSIIRGPNAPEPPAGVTEAAEPV